MKNILIASLIIFCSAKNYACDKCGNYNNDNFQIVSVSVTKSAAIAATIWEITVKGKAGETTPKPVGQLNGAPVLGYVFPTSLKPSDVGFNDTEGIVALALTSHPDFDDSPLWDENLDKNNGNDGLVWHPHWVILTKDSRVEGGLAVKQFETNDASVKLPPTSPGMPMYMDSPGFQVITDNNTIRVVVPNYRINNKTDFSFDGVTAYMEVNTGGDSNHSSGALPMLGVYKVYSIASGNLSLPYKVQ